MFKIKFVFLVGLILMAGWTKGRTVSVYDPATNMITLVAGVNTLKSIYDDVSDSAVLNYDSVANTYTLFAEISGQNGVDADLILADSTLIINSTATPGRLIKTWSDLTIQNMVIKAADPVYTWKIWAYSAYTEYSLTITDSDFSGGQITVQPKGYQEPSTPVVIKNNIFHDFSTSDDCMLNLGYNSAVNAYVYNNTFNNVHLNAAVYNGIIKFNGGTAGLVVDKITITNSSAHTFYGMVYFYGTTGTQGSETFEQAAVVSNFEIIDNNQGFHGGKEWGNVIIRDGIIKTHGTAIKFYRGYNAPYWHKAKYWVWNVSVNDAIEALHNYGYNMYHLVDLYNTTISNVGTVYTIWAEAGYETIYQATNVKITNCAAFSRFWGVGNMEIRTYELADIKVIDLNNNPVANATVTIAYENPDGIAQSVNRVMPGGMSIGQPCYGEGLQELVETSTLANGHTPLPTEDQARTIALLRHRKTLTLERSDYAYNVTAEKSGYIGTVTGIKPGENWYRENPNTYQNTITIVIPIILENVLNSDQIDVYPNPYIKGKSIGERINFANVPKEAAIKIYNSSGVLVKELSAETGGKAEWDILNEVSGIYLYTVNSPTGTKRGKVSIIK